jgi:hypothetical protein
VPGSLRSCSMRLGGCGILMRPTLHEQIADINAESCVLWRSDDNGIGHRAPSVGQNSQR